MHLCVFIIFVLIHIIQDNAPFDPRKLFGWQPVNTLASDGKEKELKAHAGVLITIH